MDVINWESYSDPYLRDLHSPYHFHRLAMVWALMRDVDQSQVVDFGCGNGFLLSNAASGTGIDVSQLMIEEAIKSLPPESNIKFLVGGIEKLRSIEASSASLILAVNVLSYLDELHVDEFYTEAFRILHPGGHLAVTHSNELFDLFTFNSFTVAFFQKHFEVDVTTLLQMPTLPERRRLPSQENPLTFGERMKAWGFQELKQEFCIPHEIPPLLDPSWNPDAIAAREVVSVLDCPPSERWKNLLRCSIFGSQLKRHS